MRTGQSGDEDDPAKTSGSFEKNIQKFWRKHPRVFGKSSALNFDLFYLTKDDIFYQQ